MTEATDNQIEEVDPIEQLLVFGLLVLFVGVSTAVLWGISELQAVIG